MADKLSDLLAAERLRPIWRRHVVQPIVSDAEPARGTVRENIQAELAQQIELKAAQIKKEAPAVVLRRLDAALKAHLGSRYLLLGYLLHPLRSAVERVQQQGVNAALHPLCKAAEDSVPRLIDRMDDVLTTMLRMQRRSAQLLERLW